MDFNTCKERYTNSCVITAAIQEALDAIINDPNAATTTKDMAKEKRDEVHDWHDKNRDAFYQAVVENRKRHKSKE